MERRASRAPFWAHPALGVAVGVSALLALGVWRSRRRVRETAERFPPRGELVELDDGSRIHVVRRGEPGEDPTVVCIHGSDGILDSWDANVMDAIAEEGCCAIAVDRPGHGWSVASPGMPLGIERNMKLIREAVRALGVDRVVLLGHSYGAAVSLRWALEHPEEVAGLVLLSPAAYFTWPAAHATLTRAPALPVVGPALAESLLPWLGPAALHFVSHNIGFGPNPVPDAYRSYSRAFYLRPSQFAALAEEQSLLSADLRAQSARYGEIAVPTRILVGADDPLTRPEQQALPLAEAIAGAQVRVLPNLAHEMVWHASAEVVAAVREVRRGNDYTTWSFSG